jgi:zinc D-Ala-D-Ala carboxypeptidase
LILNVHGVDNAEVADWIYKNLETDQIILEFYTPGEPNSGWIHASYVAEKGRTTILESL